MLAAGACKGDTRNTPLDAVTTSTTAQTDGATSSTAVGSTASGSATTVAAQKSPTTGVGTNVGGPPTSVAAIPFPAPKPGAYRYHERIQPQSGDPSERTVRYEISAVKGRTGVVRWDETDPVTGAGREKGDHYEEIHDRDGLYLLASIVLGRDECRWSPRSALLPRVVIQGGETETRSTCTVPIDGKPTNLTLVTHLKFLRTHDYNVAGKTRPAIDVDRVRSLSGDVNGAFTITSRAVDTYAFDLGVRVKTEDHSTTESGGRRQESTRVLTLTSAP